MQEPPRALPNERFGLRRFIGPTPAADELAVASRALFDVAAEVMKLSG
jgi:hypothetical protein